MRRHWLPPMIFVVLGLIVFTYQYCSLPSRTPAAGPFFSLKFGSSQLSSMQTSQIAFLSFCFSQIKFIPYIDLNNPNPTAVTQKFDFDMDDVTYSKNGTSLSFVSLPAGKYQSIQIKLAAQCSSGRSVQLTNTHGTFSTTNTITITLLGFPTYLEITDATSQVILNIDNVIPTLLGVTGDTQIKSAIEATDGSF
ncbi:MAG: hypothetical protein A4S09_15965 [Proteobacteria bacterium SG_bin7]|nr:MAG: hypothetical protein A4S09_15965 [Proteobacteria bacterium SG_bin7]